MAFSIKNDDFQEETYRFRKKEIMVFRLDPEVFENGVGPKPLHVVPILDLSMPDRIIYSITWP